MSKQERFSAARSLAAELGVTLGQALSLVTGYRVHGRTLSEWREYTSEPDRPYLTLYGIRRTYF